MGKRRSGSKQSTQAGKSLTGDPESPLDSKRYYRIGEVSRISGVKTYVLRYWESEFRWMAPVKSRTKQRLYRKRDIEIILMIKKLLHEERYTIAGARKKLKDLRSQNIKGRVQNEADAGVMDPHVEGQLRLGLDDVPRNELLRIREELQTIRELL